MCEFDQKEWRLTVWLLDEEARNLVQAVDVLQAREGLHLLALCVFLQVVHDLADFELLLLCLIPVE